MVGRGLGPKILGANRRRVTSASVVYGAVEYSGPNSGPKHFSI
jgi:hypothetical protein